MLGLFCTWEKSPKGNVTYEWSYDSSTNTVFQKIRYNGYVYPKD